MGGGRAIRVGLVDALKGLDIKADLGLKVWTAGDIEVLDSLAGVTSIDMALVETENVIGIDVAQYEHVGDIYYTIGTSKTPPSSSGEERGEKGLVEALKDIILTGNKYLGLKSEDQKTYGKLWQSLEPLHALEFLRKKGELDKDAAVTHDNMVSSRPIKSSLAISLMGYGGAKLIVFDLDSTLYTSPELEEVYEQELCRWVVSLKIARQKSEVELRLQELGSVDAVLDSYGVSRSDYLSYLEDHVDPSDYLMPDLVLGDILSRLGKYYKLVVLTNNSTKLALKTLRALGIESYFNEVFGVDKVKVPKPNPDGFQHIIDKYGVEPHQVVSIGDREEFDLNPAEHIGMHTLLVEGAEALARTINLVMILIENSTYGLHREFLHTPCPTCGTGYGHHQTQYAKDFFDYRYDIVKCEGCDMVFVNPRPGDQLIESMYSKAYFDKTHSVDGEGPGYDDYFGAERQRRMGIAKDKLNDVEGILDEMGVLEDAKEDGVVDVGCAAGYFLNGAKERGWNTYGVELSGAAADVARMDFGLRVFVGSLEQAELPPLSAGLVTMFDVFEHLPYPEETVIEVNRVLKLGGFFVLDSPNIESRVAKHQGGDFWNIKFDHILYWSPETAGVFLEELGFEVVSVSTEIGTLRDPAIELGFAPEGSNFRIVARKVRDIN